jgi:hypothetical protein
MICAIVDNDLVEQVRDVSQEEFDQGIANLHQAVINIEGLTPEPEVGWELVDGILKCKTSSTKISKLSLRQRFTFNELVAIKTAAMGNDSVAAMVSVLLDNLSVATYIDLSLPALQQGIGLLVSLGLLTSERANTIINTPPTYEELYKGIE